MSRLKDTLLGQKGYGQYAQAPLVDLRNGGHFGSMPVLDAYVSSSAYVPKNLIAILIEAPRGFQDMQDPQIYVSTLKALVELHPKSIEGLQATLTAEFVENPVGGAGEMQEDIANMTRARSTPTHVYNEKAGKPVSRFFRSWMTDIMMDPQTKYPTVVARGIRRPTDLLPDYTGMTVLYFEPDPAHTKVMEAWLCTNMMPKTSGEVSARRDLTQSPSSLDHSIEFTALTQHGIGVMQFAQRLLDAMNLNGMNPNLQKAFIQQVSADVKAADRGYAEGLQTQASNTV